MGVLILIALLAASLGATFWVLGGRDDAPPDGPREAPPARASLDIAQ